LNTWQPSPESAIEGIGLAAHVIVDDHDEQN
jgi:hypothetical protein